MDTLLDQQTNLNDIQLSAVMIANPSHKCQTAGR
jgi:hypothetical protein